MLVLCLADQAKLQNRFQFIFEAMGQLGVDPTTLTDCSDVLPTPPDLPNEPHFPAGQTLNDVEQAVSVHTNQLPALVDLTLLIVCRDSLPVSRDGPRPRDCRPASVSITITVNNIYTHEIHLLVPHKREYAFCSSEI